MRMDSYARVDEIMLLGDFDGAIEGTGTVAGADAENVGYASFAGASDDLLAVGVEARAVEVAVGVNVHGAPQKQPDGLRNEWVV